MNKLTVAFVMSTLGLACVSAYLWRQLDAEREHAQISATQLAELQADLAKRNREQRAATAKEAVPTVAPNPSVAAATPAAVPAAADNRDVDEMARFEAQRQKRWQEARQHMLEDPRERELMKAQARSEARAANIDLARELQLTDSEYDRLIELLAEHRLQLSELFTRREDRNISADAVNGMQALRDRLAEDIANLIGYEKAQQYAAYEDSRQVRTQVRRLRGRLSESDVLTDEQSQHLIAALQKQRTTFNEELQRRLPKERVSATRVTQDGGSFYADRSSTVPMQQQFMKQIEEFRKRQRQTAAEVLTARQLRAFAQMQEEMLNDERLDARLTTIVDESN